MEPREEDEMDLINAEFNSLVAGLNLDQSSPRTYLDDLAEIEAEEYRELYQPPTIQRGFSASWSHFFDSIRRWWRRPGSDDSDGAVV